MAFVASSMQSTAIQHFLTPKTSHVNPSLVYDKSSVQPPKTAITIHQGLKLHAIELSIVMKVNQWHTHLQRRCLENIYRYGVT